VSNYPCAWDRRSVRHPFTPHPTLTKRKHHNVGRLIETFCNDETLLRAVLLPLSLYDAPGGKNWWTFASAILHRVK